MIGLSLSHMHSKDIIHREIKPEKILVTSKGDFKMFIVCDLKASK
jgi:serine/threonine protein kinase